MARITNLPFLSTLTTDLILPVVDESVNPPSTRKLEVNDLITLVNDAAIQIVGPSGPSGPRGNTGAQGPQGVTGPQGSEGPQGPSGANGADGPQGIQGPSGPSGIDGPSGAAGPQGPQGPSGPSGIDGVSQPGPSGAEGPQGPTGAEGPQGPEGPSGVGIEGPQGIQGPQGPSGAAATIIYNVTNNGNVDYIFEGNYDPTITLVRGFTYNFVVNASGYPLWIKTAQVTGTGSAFTSGITNNGTDQGTIEFVVPMGAPNELYYISENDVAMAGTFTIVTLGATGAVTLGELTDVSLGTLTSGDVLYYNGTGWANTATSVSSGTGPQGPQGPAGLDGGEGPQGVTGPSGPSGPGLVVGGTTGQILAKASDSDYDTNWIDAPTGGGAVGPQGPQGPAGTTGNEGPQGPTGPSGADSTVPGPQGDPGADGPQGPTGPSGPASTLAGPTGPSGPSGADGVTGPSGADSTVEGPTGPSGPSGVDGLEGPQGPTGPSGLQGDPGNDGPSGPSGPSGVDGPQGPTGPAGALTSPVADPITFADLTGATSTATGAVIVYGGVGIGENLYVSGSGSVNDLTILSNNNAATTSSGALVVVGGIAAGGNILVDGNIASNLSNGELLTLGNSLDGADKWITINSLYGSLEIGRNTNTNAYIQSNMAVGTLDIVHNAAKIQISASDEVLIPQTTDSVDNTTGALIVSGGVGISGRINVASTGTFGTDLVLSGAYGTSGLKLQDSSATEVAVGVANGTAAWRLTLPTSAGTVGQVLTTDGNGVASWEDASSSLTGIFTITNTTNSVSTQTGALQVAGGAGVGLDLYVGGLTSLGEILRLAITTVEPTAPDAGMIVVADGITWDPATKASGLPYPVFYDGSTWNALY